MSDTINRPPHLIDNNNSNEAKLLRLQTTTTDADSAAETIHSIKAVGSLTDATSRSSTVKPLLADDTINLPDYERIQVVGQGSFGVAILYRNKVNQNVVVLKQIHLSDLTIAEKELAMNEVAVFSKLHHPNIIWYLKNGFKIYSVY